MCKNWNAEPTTVSNSETTSTSEPKQVTEKPRFNSGNAAVKNHPVRLEDFYMKHPSFVWGPLLVAGLLYGASNHVPFVVKFLQDRQMEAFGWTSAWQYTVFAIVASYAFHGFCATHAPQQLKVQADKEYEVKPDAMAIRSTAALITELVYTFVPLAPATDSWWKFAAWCAVLAVYWDAHFYVAHRICHENKAAYRFFHKTHHLCKAPNCFGAYFVTYQSHIVLEQLVVFILAAAGLPRNVFVFSLYWGTIGTYLEHCGYELGEMKMPLLPVTFGRVSQAMGFGVSLVLDGKFFAIQLVVYYYD